VPLNRSEPVGAGDAALVSFDASHVLFGLS